MISSRKAHGDARQLPGPGEAGAGWFAAGNLSRTDIRLETLYRALNREYPDARILEIVGDLVGHGLNLAQMVEKVHTECGAMGAGRLRRIANPLA